MDRDGVQLVPSFQSRAGPGAREWGLQEEGTWQSLHVLALLLGLLEFTSIVSKGKQREPWALNQATAHQGPLLRPRASWALDPASAFELTHTQHVNDGVAQSKPSCPTPHTH